MAIECVLGERRLRGAIKLAGFGVILVFVIYGSFYHDQSSVQRKLHVLRRAGEQRTVSSRRLLSDNMHSDFPENAQVSVLHTLFLYLSLCVLGLLSDSSMFTPSLSH